MKYRVEIVETNYYDIEVEAGDEDEAREEAFEIFDNGCWPVDGEVGCFGISLLDGQQINQTNKDLEPISEEDFESILKGESNGATV